MSDSQLSGNQSPACIPKVPVEGDVCFAEVLAGVVESDGEGDRPVLDEAHVGHLDVIDLVQRDSEGDLIWGGRQSMMLTNKWATDLHFMTIMRERESKYFPSLLYFRLY